MVFSPSGQNGQLPFHKKYLSRLNDREAYNHQNG